MMNCCKNCPNAKFIYLLRNPEQAIISRRKNFINESNWKIEQHINAWKKSVEAFEKFQKNYPSKIKIIKLEDLTKNTNNTMIKICDFLKINFQENKLSDYKNMAKQVSLTSESWKKDVENKEISISISINHKKLNLSDRIKLVENLKDFLKKYDYFEKEYKELDLNLENIKPDNIEDINSTIEEAFEILCSISVVKNPIKKYRAYKNLLKVYDETK